MAVGVDLRQVVVWVTGASRGLGRALAFAYADAGARLVLCARGAEALGAVAADLEAQGTEVEWAPADVSDEAAIAELADRAGRRFGGIHVLVTNASILGSRVPLGDQPLAEWRDVLETNLTGALIPIQAVLPGMRAARAGSIINITSGAGNEPRSLWAGYAVSKWGIEALTRNLALEEAGHGVRVNMVDPGRLRTAMRREAYPDEDPTRPVPPESAVGVFLWLASPDSADATGQRFEALAWP